MEVLWRVCSTASIPRQIDSESSFHHHVGLVNLVQACLHAKKFRYRFSHRGGPVTAVNRLSLHVNRPARASQDKHSRKNCFFDLSWDWNVRLRASQVVFGGYKNFVRPTSHLQVCTSFVRPWQWKQLLSQSFLGLKLPYTTFKEPPRWLNLLRYSGYYSRGAIFRGFCGQ